MIINGLNNLTGKVENAKYAYKEIELHATILENDMVAWDLITPIDKVEIIPVTNATPANGKELVLLLEWIMTELMIEHELLSSMLAVEEWLIYLARRIK